MSNRGQSSKVADYLASRDAGVVTVEQVMKATRLERDQVVRAIYYLRSYHDVSLMPNGRGQWILGGEEKSARVVAKLEEVGEIQFASPFEIKEQITEPPIGAVLAFQRGFGGITYDYVALRASNGLWYFTGGRMSQGLEWEKTWPLIKRNLVSSTPVKYATAWAELADDEG